MKLLGVSKVYFICKHCIEPATTNDFIVIWCTAQTISLEFLEHIVTMRFLYFYDSSNQIGILRKRLKATKFRNLESF